MNARTPRGWWTPEGPGPTSEPGACRELLADLSRELFVLEGTSGHELGVGGQARLGGAPGGPGERALAAVAAPLRARDLGSPAFCRDLGVRFPYVAGAMAGGIASVELVEALARAGMLGIFGAAGLPLERVAQALDRLEALGELPWGSNLIHTPQEPRREAEVVDLYLRRGVRTVSASAYLGLTLPLVRYRTHGLRRRADGGVEAPNRVLAKVSRVEVAEPFFSPPPAALLRELVARGELSEEQAALAARIPVAQDLTAEADSGGHTDNRPLVALVPTMLELRDRLQARHGYAEPLRVGAAGGLGTPRAVRAAFALGAAYVLTGSINQACRESGTSDAVRTMLAEAGQADVAMAPAADMFEMGVKVQVLKRGTMFAMRAAKLYELYRAHASLEELPPGEVAALEQRVLRATLAETWASTRAWFERHDPAQVEQAERDPRHKMALVFRSYLGQSSRWALAGDPARRVDYQVWCGPAMGAFNAWVRGTFLEQPAQRDVLTVALNLLHGAALLARVEGLAHQGVTVPPAWLDLAPRAREALEARLS